MIMHKTLYCLALVFAGILPLAAQPDSASEKLPGGGRYAWFACLSKPQGLENPVSILAGDKLFKLELPEFMASDAVAIPADGILRIVRATPDPANQGKMKYLILAEAKIPENVREALVIMTPVAKPENNLLFETKIQNLANFKGGDRLYINLSDSNIRVRLGKTAVAVEPRQANIYKAPSMAEATNMPIMYEFYHPERQQWKILSASTVVLRPSRREIYVFNNGSRIGNIKKHGILFPVQSTRP